MAISFNPATLLNGNGIDVATVVSEVLSQKSGQLTFWQARQATLQAEASALDTINTDLNNLQTAVNTLRDPLGPLMAVSADSSLPGVLTATAQPSAAAGNHTIVVSDLATAGTVYTEAVAGGADVSILPSGATGGDLQLEIGGSGGSIKDIPITAGSNDTLNKLVSYINQQSNQNNWGVTAAVLSDATGARLAIYSQQTGTPGALAITANTTTGTLYTADLAGADTSILPDGQTSGDIQLQVGGAGGATFDIPITSGGSGSNDTLNTLADYINQQSTQNNWGVTASVVNDADGSHLALISSKNGPAGGLAFTSNNTLLTTVANPATSLVFQTPIGGTNASLTIDGIPFESTSNTVTGALPGVTLNLVSAEPTMPLQLSVGPDATQATNAISAFVIAYNTLVTAINHQFAVDPTTNNEGPLGSDSSLRSLQSSILADAGYSVSGNAGLVNLASLGITMNDDGTLSVNSTKVSDALSANPSAFLNFFQNSGATGFGNVFGTDLNRLTDAVSGVINLDISENSSEQSTLGKEISNFQDQLAVQKQVLTQQFSQVNATLEQYPYLLAEITSQLTNLLPSSSAAGSNSGPATGSAVTLG